MFGPSKKIKYVRVSGKILSWTTSETEGYTTLFNNVVFQDDDGDRLEVDRLLVPLYLEEEVELKKSAEYFLCRVRTAEKILAALVAFKIDGKSLYRKSESEVLLKTFIRATSTRHAFIQWYAFTAVIGGWILWAIAAGFFSSGGLVGLLGGILSMLIPALWAYWLIFPSAFWKKYGNMASFLLLLKSYQVDDIRSSSSLKY